MTPKPVIGFCEFFYHYIHDQNDTKTLLHLLQHVSEARVTDA